MAAAAGTEGSKSPRVFFLSVFLFCSFYFVIRLMTIEERVTVPQLKARYKTERRIATHSIVAKLHASSNRSSHTGLSNSSLSERLTTAMLNEDVPRPTLMELNKSEATKEEHRYYKDDQYLMYKDRCPTSVRYRIANNSNFKHKYIEDMPILMWDKHVTPSEYKRLYRYININGFGNMDYTSIASAMRKMNTENNMYMFDDLLRSGGGKRCIRCAIIGNGGILNGSRMGAEIDSHDYVFRVNTAVTKGFEKDVGSKTSFYCFTMVTLSNTLAGSRKFGFTAPPNPLGIRYLVFADNEWTYRYFAAHFSGQKLPRSNDRYNRYPPKFNIPVTPDIVKIVHPDFQRYLKWSWVNSSQQHKSVHRPTTGAIMLLVALHTCDEVNAYGFGGSYSKYSDHYYEPKFSQHRFYANHDDKTEQKMWHLLNKEGIIKLYTRDDEER